jgi:uncharacterized RDD family membrane protein YckC
MPPLVANTSQRLFAGFVDVGPLMLISLVGSVLMAPFDPSAVAARLIAAAGLLLKDITGASPGKWLAGLRVTDRDGRPAGTVRRVLRNVTIAAVLVLLGVPILGRFAAVICLIEMALVLVRRDRLGDRLAGTTVVRRAVLPEISAA